MLKEYKVVICLLGMFTSFYSGAQTFTKSFTEATAYQARAGETLPDTKPQCSGNCYHSGKNLYNYKFKVWPQLKRTDGQAINCRFGNSQSTIGNNQVVMSGTLKVGTNGWNSSGYQSLSFNIPNQPNDSYTSSEISIGTLGVKAWNDHKMYLDNVNVTIYVDPENCPLPPTVFTIKAFWVKQYSGNTNNDLTYMNVRNNGMTMFTKYLDTTCSTTLNIDLPSEITLNPGERKQLLSYSNVWNSCKTSKNRDFYAKFTWDNSGLDKSIERDDGVVISNGLNDRLDYQNRVYYVIAPSQVPVGKTLLGNLNVEVTWP
ncbi:TPA: hypothetical protein SI540_004589 [Escherichia coli]|nr:hypothetical protein [Escherichia coli]HEI2488332.1 hypothetical protein [Escherichia coli]HEI2493872.1 hypothetical protein [Escherichia coli]HEI2555883.1 hypothetical protein [Escherichia coli]HEI2570399.1 hypothetical protein [Escherichia coli]